MLQRLLGAAGVIGAAAGLWAGAGQAAPPAAAKGRPAPHVSDLLVYATEWRLTLSRAGARAGIIDVELWNRGEDAHDVEVERIGADGQTGRVLAKVAVTQPGKITKAVWRLTAGRYELFCSLPGHREMGMTATFLVTPG